MSATVPGKWLDLVGVLNALAGNTNANYQESAGAANTWAGITLSKNYLSLLGALNYKNGSYNAGWLNFNDVCCSLAGVPRGSMEGLRALNKLNGYQY